MVRNLTDPSLGDRIANCRDLISRWRKKDQLNSTEVIEGVNTRMEEAQNTNSTFVEEITVLRTNLGQL